MRSCDFYLKTLDNRVCLISRGQQNIKPFYVDFTRGAVSYRAGQSKNRKQLIARAVGLKGGLTPRIVDFTAGFGRDAFILASLGCRVHMVERHPLVAELLSDGLKRARQDQKIGSWVAERISMVKTDSLSSDLILPFEPDVVYLDPMFPPRQKSALVKKDMRLLQSLIGKEADSGELLSLALTRAASRVVVKRPLYAEPLGGKTPDTQIKTKLNRFDIYLKIKEK